MTASRPAWDEEADYVVVGTGAAGATAGFDLARAGRDVVLVEEGGWFTREDFRPDLYSSLARLWRDFGVQPAVGRALFPVAQGCCVGGSTTINTAIMHRMPRDSWDAWVARDAGLRQALAWEDLEQAAEAIERDLEVRANVAGRLGSLPLARALDRLGWPYRAMPRAAPGCRETRRCIVGCPSGGKWSLERSFVPGTLERGGRLLPDCRVARVLLAGGTALGIEAVRRPEPGRGEERLRVRARQAVLIAAGAVHSPLLLKASGVRGPHLGRHFQCHIGTNVLAEFERPAAAVEGGGMGCEVFHPAGIKFSSIQSTPAEIKFGYAQAVGRELAVLVRRTDHIATWNTSLPCTSEGTVRRSPFGGAMIRITPAPADYACARTGIAALARLFFELGAVRVFPQINGAAAWLTEPAQIAAIETTSLEPRDYHLNCSHIFGTCRMASDPGRGVVDPSFRVHGARRLYVVDASVFPSPVGTNPQEAIMTLARHAVRRLLA